MNKKYSIIYADPAWSYNDKSMNRGGAERHYDTMSIEDIKLLPINDISAENSVLFIWSTFPMLQEALYVIKAWGFTYKTIGFNWVKTNKLTNVNQTSFLPTESFDVFWGMGNWTRSNSEVCLLAVKGKPTKINSDVHSVVYAPISKHSKKPDEVRDRIVRLVGDLPRVELFARQKTEGWDIWGNELDNSLDLTIKTT